MIEVSSGEPSTPSVGVSIPRVDGVDKVTGAALYVDDLPGPEAWFGGTVRSDVSHGRLRSIRLDPAFDWSTVVVVTADDIPGKNVVALIEDDQPSLVAPGGTIRHCEEPVVLLAAPTRELLGDAIRHVTLDVESRPAVLSMEESLAGAGPVHGTDNIFKELEIHKGGDVESALEASHLIIEGTYRTGAQEQMYIEPQGMLAHWEGETCHVTGSLQCPYYVHRALVELLGRPEEHVIVTQAVTGGGFGGKEEYPSLIAGHAALLARKAGVPVRLVYDREEDIAATTKRHPAVVHHRLGLDPEGRITAMDIDVTLDGGAYVTLSPVVLSRAIIHAAGPYRSQHVRVRGRVVATHHPPYGAFRGFGAPQATFAYERQMQKAARALGIDAFELRRRNMIRPGDSTSTGQTLTESIGAEAVLDAVEKAAPGPTTGEPPPDAGSSVALAFGADPSRLRRGRGLAFYFHGAGFTGSGEAFLQGKATVATRADGHFEVRSSSTEIGQGTLTIFSQMVADELQVPISSVVLAIPSTSRVPDSGPTVASRTCMVVGSVVTRAAAQLRHALEEYAQQHSLDPADLSAVARHHHGAKGERSETVTHQLPPGIEWDDETYTGAAYPTYAWATCLVDVTVDVDTCEVTVDRCIHAIDVGHAIHPVIVKGQIEGGTLQALGWALNEHVVVEDGRFVNRRMTDCIIPTALDAPEMETILVEMPFAYGPHGAKGIGEIPTDGPAAAVAGAIEDALGCAVDEVPALPERLAEIFP